MALDTVISKHRDLQRISIHPPPVPSAVQAESHSAIERTIELAIQT